MRIDRVVVNASPLITLFKSNQAQLLPALFRSVHVPDAVWREVSSETHADQAARGLAKRRGVIPAVEPGLRALMDVGLWLSSSLIKTVLIEAGER